MNTAAVLEDGTVKLPPEVAAGLHLKAGDTMGLEVDAGGTIRLYPKRLKPADVCGMLGTRTTVKATLEEMDQGIADAFEWGAL